MRQFLFSPHDRETFYTFDARVYTDHPFFYEGRVEGVELCQPNR